ncbi:MAG TPA: secretin N-terminal domain-containing protein [Burkholderiales bacterium]
MGLSRAVFTTVLITLASNVGVAAQGSLEIIPLRHRAADQVLPALRPLLEPGATLTGQGTQLIVRTSPSNLDELRRALDEIDRPLRRLQVSVRFDDAGDAASRSVETSGRISNRGSSVEVQAQDARSAASGRVDQRVQVLEGGRAFIATGRSTPIYDGSVTRETASGFDAIPRLAGDKVLVEIAQRRDTPGRQQALSTTVSGRPGEWLDIGDALEGAARDDRAFLSARTSRSTQSGRVWLKVDEIRP